MTQFFTYVVTIYIVIERDDNTISITYTIIDGLKTVQFHLIDQEI